jgi:hypothetical protein
LWFSSYEHVERPDPHFQREHRPTTHSQANYQGHPKRSTSQKC